MRPEPAASVRTTGGFAYRRLCATMWQSSRLREEGGVRSGCRDARFVRFGSLPLLKAYKDSSVAMMRALVARGHTLSVAMQGDLYIEKAPSRRGHAISWSTGRTCTAMTGGAKPGRMCAWPIWARSSCARIRPSTWNTCIHPPAGIRPAAGRQGLQHRRGHPQSPGKAGHHRNQRVHRAHAGDPQHGPPESLPRQAPGRDRQAAGRHGRHRRVPAAAKDPNLNAILETLTDNGARTIMAQRYIPRSSRATSASC